MAQQPVGYFDYNGEQRYRDSQGNVYHNHLGPALNSIGNAFGLKSGIKNWTDKQHERLSTKNTGTKNTDSNSYAGPGGNPNSSGQGQAQQKPGMGPYQGHSVPTPTSVTPTVPTRDVPKANGAKGTQTSPGGGMPTLTAATVAQRLGASNIGLGAYSSIQLPGTATNPNTGRPIEAQPFSGQEPAVTTNTLGAFSNNGVNVAALDNTGISTQDAFTNPALKGVVGDAFAQYGALGAGNGAFAQPTQGSNSYTEISPTNPIYAEAFGEDLAKKNGNTGSSRLDAALADTAGMRSYMSKFGSPEQDKRRAADMAFLNAGTAQEGLRAKEAVLGQYHAGGQTYQLNDAGTELLQSKNGGPLAMDRDAASSYRLGTSTAQDYKNSYKDQVKDVMPATPKQAENSNAQNPAAVTEMPTNTNLGPTIDDEVYARNMESFKGMQGIGPVISGESYVAALGMDREPLMRDPRKK